MKTQKKQSRLSGAERVDQIYRVAAQMICERGYDGASMSDIADAVGISKAGVYHFIPSKKELLFTIMSYGMDTLEAAVIRPAEEIANAEERLRFIITSHAMLIARSSNDEGHDPVTILVEEELGLSPDLPVHSGIHDSNASLLPHVLARKPPFADPTRPCPASQAAAP